jgi:hypothetical protein
MSPQLNTLRCHFVPKLNSRDSSPIQRRKDSTGQGDHRAEEAKWRAVIMENWNNGRVGKTTRKDSSYKKLVLILIRGANSHSARLHRHDRSRYKLALIPRNHLSANWSLFSGRYVHKPQDSGMSKAFKDRDLAEVFIQGHQNTAIVVALWRISLSPGSSGQSPAHTMS